MRALGEYRGKQQLLVAQSPQILDDLKELAVIESTESSNRLEGVTVAPARLKSLVSGSSEPKSRSQGWHEGANDAQPWLDYFWGAMLRAYKEFEERVGTIDNRRGSKSDRVRTEVLKRNLSFSISDIEQSCPGVSRDTVRMVLRTLKAEGLIESTGNGRSAKWRKNLT